MRNYLVHFFVVVLSFSLPATFFAWWAEPVAGDLTRIGKWAEHDFGPNVAHPAIQIRATGRALINPDVLVLGDSFAIYNLWQSVLSDRTGYAVKSFTYDKNCLASWIEAAIAEPANKVVIVETLERLFVPRFGNIAACPSTAPIPVEVAASTTAILRPTWPPTLSWSYLVPTAINTARLNTFPEKDSNRSGVINREIDVACSRFSNRRNDRLLYYSEDDQKQKLTPQKIDEAVANVLKIQKAVERSGKTFVFILVPDKSTIYQSCFTSDNAMRKIPNINNALITAGVNAPDMHKIFYDKKTAIVDLYLPNDTHWSAAGYILAGETVGRYVTSKSLGK